MKNSCKNLKKSIKYFFCNIKHGLKMTSYFQKLKLWNYVFARYTWYLFCLPYVKNSQFWCHIVWKKMNGNKIYFLWHQAWPHNDLLLLKTKVQLLHHTYLWPPLIWHNKAMDMEKNEAMATKFSEKSDIDMLKKHRRFCRRGFTHLDATPIFQKSSRYLWDTL